MDIQLMTDGGADLPKELQRSLNIFTVPLNIHFKDTQYKIGNNPDLEMYYKKIKQESDLPKTSAPSPYDFYEAYKQIDASKPVIMISLTKPLSATYHNALLGKEMLLEEDSSRQIEVINTKTASCGMALLIHEAWKHVQKGMPFKELVVVLKEKVEHMETLISFKTLNNIIKSGRLDRVRGSIAKTLNVKLLMKASPEGEIVLSEKVRGNKKAVRRFIEQIGEYTTNFEEKTIAMSHCNCEERAKNILNAIKEKYPFKDSLFIEMGPLIATHAGEGGIVISFFRD